MKERRLIDADALMRDIERYHLSDGKFQHWVEVQPTIDAIPIEWIMRYSFDGKRKHPISITEMIADWRKEQ